MASYSRRFEFSVGDRTPDRHITAFAERRSFFIGVDSGQMDRNADYLLRIRRRLQQRSIYFRRVVHNPLLSKIAIEKSSVDGVRLFIATLIIVACLPLHTFLDYI